MSVTSEPGLEINVPLLRKTLEHITAHPDEHDQYNWAIRDLDTACGTAFCLAGHAVQFAGHEIAWGGPNSTLAHFVADGRWIDAVATVELGLHPTQAELLFQSDNSRQTLWHLANGFTNGAIEIPEEFL